MTLQEILYGTFVPPDVPRRAHRILDAVQPIKAMKSRRQLPTSERVKEVERIMRLGKFMSVSEIAERANLEERAVRTIICKFDKQFKVLRKRQRVGGDQRFVHYRISAKG